MVFLGRISYSLYIWHWPIFIALRGGERGEPLAVPAPDAIGFALAAALASYYLVELPFLRRKNRRRARVDVEAGPLPATA